MRRKVARRVFAKRSLGQNFLIDEAMIGKIVGALDPKETDTVLEIGPGRGALTTRLIDTGADVVALEFDRDLASALSERFADQPNFRLIEDDALGVDFQSLKPGDGRKLRLIANLPYNISTAILQRLFDHPDVFSDAVLMFQREVVERITAAPGTKDRGFLTVLTEAHSVVERLFDVPPGAFRPVPKVWSSVVRLTPKPSLITDERAFRDLVSTAFNQKRKTLHNNLKARFPNVDEALEAAGIAPDRRAETLTLGEWLALANALN